MAYQSYQSGIEMELQVLVKQFEKMTINRTKVELKFE
mgnify:CR=1 FL=1